jgi:hypothetical protein
MTVEESSVRAAVDRLAFEKPVVAAERPTGSRLARGQRRDE